MQNRAKKILALLLMVCLVVGLLPMGALAAQGTGGAEIVAQQLSLGDDLDMRYYVAIDESLTQSAVMNITAGNAPATSYEISKMTPNADGNYVFTVALAAAQMTDDIKLSLVDGENELLSKTYSVYGYAKVLLEGNYDDETKAMVKEMLNYGAKAQAYFNYNYPDKPANAGYEIEPAAAVPGEELTVDVNGSVSGIRFYGASLVYSSQVAVRFYFTADSVEGISFKVDDIAYDEVSKNGMFYVEIPGINPQDYENVVNLVVSNGTDDMTVGYSPLHYIIRMYNKASASAELKNLLHAMYGYYTVASAYVGEDISVSKKFHIAGATEGITYDEELGTISNDGQQNTTELFFAADGSGSYARNWELTGTVTRENVESVILSFGVKDKDGKTQWFGIKEHAASLDNEGNNTIYDDVHAWWNSPSCGFYWRYEDAMTINYKITVIDDVLRAYFGRAGEEPQQAWSFPLTEERFGGFAVDSEYQLGIFTRVACGMEMTDVAVTTDNTADSFQVSSSTAGITYDKTAGTISYDGSQNTTELFFGAKDNDGYARNWELTGTVARENVESMILSFGVKDKDGKTQWFSIKEHAAGLDNEGNNTIYNDVNAWWNQPACGFYWRTDGFMTINYKITVIEDVLCAYFGTDSTGLMQAWYFPLTDSQFGGFAVDSEYQLGIFTRVACGMEMTAVATATDNRADKFHVASNTSGVSYNKTEGTITYDGSQETTELFFGAKDNDGYARSWEISGDISKTWTEGMILSFGVKDKAGKTQWFSIKEHAAGLDNEGNNTIYNDVNAWWNAPSCNFYWNNALTMSYKIVVVNDVLYAYYGTDSNNLQHAWTFPLTDSQFGGFTMDSEYQVGIFTRKPCAMNFTNVTSATDNTPDAFYLQSSAGGITADTVNGTITADGTGNTETYLAAAPNAPYATDWEMTGTLTKTNSKDETLFVSFGVFDAAGREQWFTILGNSMSRQWYYNWWDSEYKPDGEYVFPNAAALNFFDRGTDTISYKLVIEKDTLKMYFGADSSDLKLAWNLPLTNSMFGYFVPGDAYRIGIRTVDPCAFTISDVKVTTKGVQSDPDKIVRRNEIQIRDPYILVDNGTYYLYGTQNFGSFNVYTSTDLNYWTVNDACFVGADDFWGNASGNVEGAEAAYWAPEVYEYDGAYYMFATFTQNTETMNQQGTAVLKADSPMGPFEPWSDGPITPAGHSCLDGTLHIENGTPYLIYAHEWQCSCRNYSGTGTINYIQRYRRTQDLHRCKRSEISAVGNQAGCGRRDEICPACHQVLLHWYKGQPEGGYHSALHR